VLVAGLNDWLMFVHIVAAMAWVGGLLVLTVLATIVLRSGEREALTRFVGTLSVIGPYVLAPATVLVLGFGIWLVVDTDAYDQLGWRVWGMRLSLLLLLVVTWDTVFKPGL